MNIKKKVLEIVRATVSSENRARVEEEARLKEDLGLDSMGLVRLVLALEEGTPFDIENCDIDLTQVRTVGDVVSMVTVSSPQS